MSISKCQKCGKSIFQIESLTPIGTDRDILCVMCHNCNTVVGTLDHAAVEHQNEIGLQIKVINSKLDTINHNIGQLMNGMKLVYTKLNGKDQVKF